MKELKEYKLSDPIKKYFNEKGYIVYPEITFYESSIDLVARKDNIIIGIELKTGLTKKVIHQCYLNQIGCDFVYAVIPTKPQNKNIEKCKKHGIGIIRINNKIEIILKAENNIKTNRYNHYRLLEYCSGKPLNIDGGLPNLKGIGPAIECSKRVKKYLLLNPNASWKEIYHNVDNHYCSVNSMRSALRNK